MKYIIKTLEIGIPIVRGEVEGNNFAFFYILSNGYRITVEKEHKKSTK